MGPFFLYPTDFSDDNGPSFRDWFVGLVADTLVFQFALVVRKEYGLLASADAIIVFELIATLGVVCFDSLVYGNQWVSSLSFAKS